MHKSFIQKIIYIFFLFLAIIMFNGCGGGGGGGSSSSNIIPTYPQLADILNFLSDLPKPIGLQSFAFPANLNQSNLSINSFSADKTAHIMFINTSPKPTYAFVNAILNPLPSVSIIHSKSTFPNSYDNSKVLNTSKYTPNLIPSANFQRKLRELEQRLPPIKNDPIQNKSNKIEANITNNTVEVGTEHEFQLPNFNNQPIIVRAVCYKKTQLPNQSNSHLLIFVDKNDGFNSDTNQFITKLSNTFVGDTLNIGIYTKVREIFGEEPPANFNNVNLGNDIYILITSSVSNIDSSLAGFFWSGDLYPPSNVNPPISNQKKIFYLTNITHRSVPPLTDYTMLGTLAHEFQHMINFYQRKKNNLVEHTWLNEAFSGYAEHICGYSIATNNQSKALQINEYFMNTNNVSLTNWVDAHPNYGLVYLFGVWFAQKYSPNNSGVISDFLKLKKVGTDAISEYTKEPFEKVLAKFYLALTINDQNHSIYGINGLDLTGNYAYPDNLSPVKLTGPKIPSNLPLFNGSYPYSSNEFYLQQHAFAVFKFIGTNNASNLYLSFSQSTPVFEFHN